MREGRIISNYDAEFPYLNFVYHIVCIVGKERQELEKERTKKKLDYATCIEKLFEYFYSPTFVEITEKEQTVQ